MTRLSPQRASGDARRVVLMTRGMDSSVVADILYAVGDERLVITVDETLPRRELATEVITNVIAMRDDPLEVLDDPRDMAEELGWTLAIDASGARTDLRIS